MYYNLACNTSPDTDSNPASVRPGMTGVMVCHTDGRDERGLSSRKVEYLSIADTPVYVISSNGTISPLYVANNSKFDAETVTLMRELIRKDVAKNADEARNILISEGYFARSYDEKTNSYSGGVPVCNGSDEFFRTVSLLTSIQIDVLSISAIVFLTDGMLQHLQDVDNGINSRRLERLIQSVLLKDIRYIEGEERRTFNPNWPNRERMSDDKTAMVLNFTEYRTLEYIARNKLHYPF